MPVFHSVLRINTDSDYYQAYFIYLLFVFGQLCDVSDAWFMRDKPCIHVGLPEIKKAQVAKTAANAIYFQSL